MAGGNRRVVSFDLDTKAMEEYYPNPLCWRNGYDDIRRFITDNGFEWKQGSVYISKQPIEDYMVNIIISEMVRKHPWLNCCMRDCILASIGRQRSLNDLFYKRI